MRLARSRWKLRGREFVPRFSQVAAAAALDGRGLVDFAGVAGMASFTVMHTAVAADAQWGTALGEASEQDDCESSGAEFTASNFSSFDLSLAPPGHGGGERELLAMVSNAATSAADAAAASSTPAQVTWFSGPLSFNPAVERFAGWHTATRVSLQDGEERIGLTDDQANIEAALHNPVSLSRMSEQDGSLSPSSFLNFPAAPQDSQNVFEREEQRRIIVKGHALPLIFQSLLRNHAAQCKNFTIPAEDKHRMKDRLLRADERGQLGRPPEKKQKNDDQEEKLQKEADALIKRRKLQVCFTSLQTGLPVMTGEREKENSKRFKKAGRTTRGCYVHQGQVCEVLMGFLLKEPTLENAETSLKSIQEQVQAEYCNITNEVVMDAFRALDLCYYLYGIPRPAGSTNVRFDKHLCLEKWLRGLSEPHALSGAHLTLEAEERLAQLFSKHNVGGSGGGSTGADDSWVMSPSTSSDSSPNKPSPSAGSRSPREARVIMAADLADVCPALASQRSALCVSSCLEGAGGWLAQWEAAQSKKHADVQEEEEWRARLAQVLAQAPAGVRDAPWVCAAQTACAAATVSAGGEDCQEGRGRDAAIAAPLPRPHYNGQLVGTTRAGAILGTAACTTVVILGSMHEEQAKDQPTQRRAHDLEFRANHLELDGAVHQGFTNSTLWCPSADLWTQLPFLGPFAVLVLALGVGIVLLQLFKRRQAGKQKRYADIEEGAEEVERERETLCAGGSSSVSKASTQTMAEYAPAHSAPAVMALYAPVPQHIELLGEECWAMAHEGPGWSVHSPIASALRGSRPRASSVSYGHRDRDTTGHTRQQSPLSKDDIEVIKADGNGSRKSFDRPGRRPAAAKWKGDCEG